MSERRRTGIDDAEFHEDMDRKSDWFRELRGDVDREELDRRRDLALERIQLQREVRRQVRDPGGKAPTRGLFVSAEKPGVRAREVPNPRPSDSDHFVTAAVEITADRPFMDATLKVVPPESAAKSHDLRTARMFLWDDKMRQWNLVENSGFNARQGYVFSEVWKPGTYAAIALPSTQEEVEALALHRFVFTGLQAGLETGLIRGRDDFFDRAVFEDMLRGFADGIEGTGARKDFVKKGLRLHRRSAQIRKRLPRNVPPNGAPEWHLLEILELQEPELIEALELADVLVYLPLFRRVANRVGRWYPLGPLNVNGRIKSLAIHPTNGNVLWAGAANGGVWKTTNGGDSWRHLWKFEPTMAVGALAVARSNPDTLYAATGEHTPGYGPSYGGTGVFKSTNGGAAWTNVSPSSEVGTLCSQIVIHPTNASVVWIASNTGVHKTVNGGADWDRCRSGTASDIAVDPDHPDVLYAAFRNDGLYKSTNGGDDWDRIDGENVFLLLATLLLGIMGDFPTGSDFGWGKIALGQNGTGGTDFVTLKYGQKGEYLLVSPNGGDVWYPLSNSPSAKYNEWCTLLAVHPRDHDRIYAGAVGLAYTADGFHFHPATGTHSDHHEMVFHPTDDAVCYVATDGGVFRSSDHGQTWQLRSRYLQATQLMSLGVARRGIFVAGAATQDQGIIQTEGGSDWDDFGGGNEWGMFVVDPNDSENIYVSPGGGQLRKSTDRGRTFTNPTTGLTDWWAAQSKNTPAASFAGVAVQPDNSNILTGVAVVSDEVKDAAGTVTDTYPRKPRIYYSSDQGSSWSIAMSFPSASVRGTRVCYAPSDPNRVYVGTDDGHVYRSDDSGQSGWSKPYTNANRPPPGIITSIAVHPLDPELVYITYGNVHPHVRRSVDGGQTWEEVLGSFEVSQLPDIPVTSLVMDPEDPDILYVGTDVGVFRSNNAGLTWYDYNDSWGEYDLPRVPVSGLAIHPSTRRLFASTMGRGLYYTYTTGIYSLRVLEISHYFRGHRHAGIQYLRVTDGTDTRVFSRWEGIRRVEAGTSMYTRGPDGTRAEVQVMHPDAVHPQDYLKTVPDDLEGNNLLSLPEFYHY